MNPTFKTCALATPLLLLAACATLPNGPSVMALPGTGKTFDQFRADDYECRQYAGSSIGTTPGDAQAESVVKSAAVGTAIGALAGAVIGGHRGAGAGAGTGLLAGSLMGASAGDSSGYGAQQRYDNAYVQCMYAKGDQVPTNGQLRSAPR
jgi:outer membrane lipoprotein SlyB